MASPSTYPLQRPLMLALACLLASCIVVPRTVAVYDPQCRTYVKQVVLETEVIGAIVTATRASGVYWNRRYEPWAVAQDSRIKAQLRERINQMRQQEEGLAAALTIAHAEARAVEVDVHDPLRGVAAHQDLDARGLGGVAGGMVVAEFQRVRRLGKQAGHAIAIYLRPEQGNCRGVDAGAACLELDFSAVEG